MQEPTEFKLDGCTVRYLEGTIVLENDRDKTDRLVWTSPDADAAARIFRMLAPGLATVLRELARVGRMRRITERRGVDE